jgi:hypothetical protein
MPYIAVLTALGFALLVWMLVAVMFTVFIWPRLLGRMEYREHMPRRPRRDKTPEETPKVL